MGERTRVVASLNQVGEVSDRCSRCQIAALVPQRKWPMHNRNTGCSPVIVDNDGRPQEIVVFTGSVAVRVTGRIKDVIQLH